MFVLVKNLLLYALYIGGIVVIFLSLTGKVKYGLLFLVPLLPLQNILFKLHQFPLGKDFNDILILAMLIGWVIYKHSQGEPVFGKTPYNKVLFIYVIFTYIMLWRGSFYLGYPAPLSAFDVRLQSWKNYMILPLLFLLTLNNIKDKKEMKQLLLFMCVSMFLMSIYTIRQISWITAWWNRIKLHGTFVWLGANEVAAFYATYTFVLIGIFFLIREKKLRILLGVLIALNLYCDLFLMSRAAYLATFVALLFMSIVRNKKLIIPLVLVLLFWQTVLPQEVVERVQFTQQEQGTLDPSAQTRIVLWQQSIEYFQKSPIVGIGFDVFSHLGLKRDVHNVYLRTLAEQGLIGLGLLLFIMLFAFKRAWALYKRARDKFLKGLGIGFCACILAVIVGNFFGDRWTYLPLGAYFWVFLGMVERGNIIMENQQWPIKKRKREREDE
ncbi:MAG: O-antigen ligase family protein [Candidatus Omnitrophota bacterium]|nr:MAG: O-antigen ligase family protein [Candidatus Omnitrophota bacterium]